MSIALDVPPIPVQFTGAEGAILRSLTPTLQWLAVEHDELLRLRGYKKLQLNSGWRSEATQARLAQDTAAAGSLAELQARGLAGVAAVGQSKHSTVDAAGNPAAAAYDGEPMLANGSLLQSDADWLAYGETAESLGLIWGGRWKPRTLASGEQVTDRPHVELPGSRSMLAAALVAGCVVLAGGWVVRRLIAARAKAA